MVGQNADRNAVFTSAGVTERRFIHKDTVFVRAHWIHVHNGAAVVDEAFRRNLTVVELHAHIKRRQLAQLHFGENRNLFSHAHHCFFEQHAIDGDFLPQFFGAMAPGDEG